MRKLALILAVLTFLGLPTSWSEPSSEKTTIVLLDTSGSMRGEKLDSAKALLLNTMKAKVSNLEIYTFAEAVSKISTLGRSYKDVSSEIDRVTAGSRTSLYDSISYLVPVAEESGAPIVVISDGEDSQSTTSLQILNSLLQSRNVPVSFMKTFVDFRYESTVKSIVNSSRGEILLTIPVPQLQAPRQLVKENVSATWPFVIALAVTFLVFLLGTYLLNSRRSIQRRNQIRDLLLTSTEIDNAPTERARILNSLINRLLSRFTPQFKSNREKRFVSILALLTFFLVFFSWRNFFIALFSTIVLVVVGFRFRLKSQENRELSAFERELPGALKMLAGSLSAGLSFLQALSAYAEDGQEVSAKEFRRALSEIQLGVPIERALESIAIRMKSEDLRWAVSAFAIQREVGGSLATILNSTAETIESRFELRREIQTLSAEGRISSYILMALPIGIFIFLTVIRPNYVGVFITEPLGNLLLLFTCLGLVTAWVWMKKLVRISI